MSNIADYFCNDCQKEWTHLKERHHQFPIHPKCPLCGKGNTRRVWGNFNFVVKRGRCGNSGDSYTGWTQESKIKAAKADREKASGNK